MPLRNYGVLAGRAIARHHDQADQHMGRYNIHLVDNDSNSYRASVDVHSIQGPSALLYAVIQDFDHPILEQLPLAGSGWKPLPPQSDAGGLDYVRGRLFDPALMRTAPSAEPSNARERSVADTGEQAPEDESESLAALLDQTVEYAIADAGASVYVFGERWGPESRSDRVFDFSPGNGIHDIHMNQGNSGSFRGDDGVWQDGGLLFHLPRQSRWVAVFLAFQSQSWHTDDHTGHEVPTQPNDRVDWVSDAPASQDRLHRRPLAKSIATRLRRIREQEPDTSFLVHIDGAWGTGKTTLINLLRDELSRGGAEKWVAVDFDAWRQARVGPAWWALLVALRRSVADSRPTFAARTRLRLAESWTRLRRTGAPVVFALILLLVLSGSVFLLLGGALATAAKTTTAVLGAIGALWVGSLVAARFLLWDSATGARLFEQANTNPMKEISDHFTWLVTKAPGPVVFFIDDLDRCSESYVVELLDAVQTLVRHAPWQATDQTATKWVSFVVAADGGWIRKSYEITYTNFAETVAEPGRPLGYLFLDKLFQLRVPVPSIDLPRKQTYLASLLHSPRKQAHLASFLSAERKRTEDLLEGSSTDTEILDVLDDASPEVRSLVAGLAVDRLTSPTVEATTEHRLQRFGPLLAPNPRSMKRFLNAYSALRAVRTLEGSTVPVGPLALWAIIETRWPGLADHLRTHPESITLIGASEAESNPVPVELRSLFKAPELRRLAAFSDGEPLTPELIRICCGEAPEQVADAASD